MFFHNDGPYELAAGEHDQGLQKAESLRIHPARAIYHGVRSAWNAERLKSALFLLDGKAIKCMLDNEAIARYGIGPDDGRVAELLRKGYWTVGDLVDAAGLPPQPVHALVYALYISEALDIKSALEVPRLRKRIDTPLPPNATAASVETLREISGTHRITSGSQVTPLPQRSASHVGPLPGPTDASGAYKMPSGAFKFPSPPHSSSQRVRLPTPPGVTGLDQAAPDVDTVRKQLLAKAAVVETQNLFEVLEIPLTAVRDEVKQAYFVAAKRYHPDRLVSMGLESLRSDVEKIFRRVSEAYGTLFDDDRRNEYKSTIGKPKEDDAAAHAKAMRMLEAEMALRRGEVLLKKNDFLGSIHEFEQAVNLDPQNGENLAFLTWARVCANQTSYADAKGLLNQAVKLSPRCADAYYYLGLCLKEEKDVDRAYGMFKKAHELNARLIEAEREMRVINMRKSKEKSSGGFFDRFRKPHK
jgi:tetratricopeptide (TPR) repeat protein